MIHKLYAIFMLFLLLPFGVGCTQQLTLSPLFGSGAVLQQEMPVPVWGWVDGPGHLVSVEFDGKTYSTFSDRDGRWQIVLPAMKASDYPEAMNLIVRAGEERIVSEDILIGEVWLAAGQSNMNWSGDTVSWARTLDLVPMSGQTPKARIMTLEPAQHGRESRTMTGQSRISPSKKGCVWYKAQPARQATVGHWYVRSLQAQLGEPVGVVKTAMGGSNIISWMSEEAAEDAGGRVEQKWKKHLKDMEASHLRLMSEGDGSLEKQEARKWARHYPGANFNAGIHPLMPMAFRGVVWYQGESNAGDPAGLYQELMRAMMKDWRQRWGRPEMPIVFAQISTMQKDRLMIAPFPEGLQGRPGINLLESQRKFAEEDPYAIMAPNIDIGGDIHPQQKPDIAARLALATMVLVYGDQVEASGPVVTGIERKGNQVTLLLDHADGLFAAHAEMFEATEMPDWQPDMIMKRQYRGGPVMIFRQKGEQPVRGIFVKWEGSGLIQEVPAKIVNGKIVAIVPEGVTHIIGGTTAQLKAKNPAVLIGNVYNSALLPLLSFEYALGE